MATRKEKFYTAEEVFKNRPPLTFARVLRSDRLCDEISQKDFAKMLRITPANLCDLEKGRKIPSPRRAADIAKRLGMSEVLYVQIALQDALRAAKLPYTVSLAA
jgi:transcriptional regulator with XRE-family HTH domain